METKLNKTFTATNICTAITNPFNASFDLWNEEIKDIVAEDANVIDSVREQLISKEEAIAIMNAAGARWIVVANCSDPQCFYYKREAEKCAKSIPVGLEPIVMSVGEWIESFV